ncbi:MAG: 4-(cytidine 5'-diphospho)-2-C-methyl-D-erythritol kinase [Gemmatimonadota bacterium]|jgi:4-diphosphocytidyl-2-C-methyl-D-erythritol kinase
MRNTGSVALRAPAKVNLYLRILGARSDGFHDLETLFQALDLCDDVVVTRAEGGVSLSVEGPDLGPTEDNLAYRAALALLRETGEEQGLHVRLRKRIPAGAGLGGGSSDAAAVLRAANALLGEPVSVDRLRELGASLGSDVPFFLGSSPLALGTGRGERLQALEPLPEAHVVLALPPVHVATAAAYAALDRVRGSGAGEAPCFGTVAPRPRAWSEVARVASNDFELVVPAQHAPVRASLAAMRRAGARFSLLSGSGGACFGLFDDLDAAGSASHEVETSLGWPAPVARTLTALPVPGDPREEEGTPDRRDPGG